MRVDLRRFLAAGGLSLLALSGCASQQPDMPPPPADMMGALDSLEPNACNPTAASALASLGMQAGAVQSLQYAERIAGSGNGKAMSLDAYVGLAGGRSAVVRMSLDCDLMTAFQR